MNWLRSICKGLLCITSFGAYPPQAKPMTDEEALAHDWEMVGSDLRRAIKTVKKEVGLE